jgi:hypothetical protein
MKRKWIQRYVERIKAKDRNTGLIDVSLLDIKDAKLNELFELLQTHPTAVVDFVLRANRLTDKTGVKVAHYVAISFAIKTLNSSENRFSETSYLAIAAALRVNSTLEHLNLFHNRVVDRVRVDTAFVNALRLNPVRSVESIWRLYTFEWHTCDFKRLKDAAEKSTPPSMLEFLLCVHLETELNKLNIH